jgi:hypothetical protein
MALKSVRWTLGAWATLLALTACSAPAQQSADTQPQQPAIPCAEQNARYCAAAEGDLLEVTLDQLRPTQPSLGYDEVYYRLGRYTLGAGAADQLLDQWCVTNGQGGLDGADAGASIADPTSFRCAVAVGSETSESTAVMKTVVIGPGGQPYLTDGHHTLTSFWEAPGGGPDTSIRLKVAGNLSQLDPGAFWPEMRDRGWTWLQDAEGNPVEPQKLPASLGLKQFANDQYRGVLYFVRDVGYAQDDADPYFQEFYWGAWLRSQTDPSLQPGNFTLTELASYQTLVGNIGKAIVALPGSAEIANSRDADRLGRMKEFGEKAFEALVQPVDSAKPGKLALSIEYKTSR